MTAEPLLRAQGLTKAYGSVKAVDDVALDVGAGEVVGLVGASGSGKSTLARLLLALVKADAGTVHFAGHDLAALGGRGLRALRAELQLVPQHPATALNPRLTISSSIAFNLRAHGFGRAARRERVAELLDAVGLPGAVAGRRPRELSGGQQQRVAIARALATRPKLVVCDEAVSALDRSVQAQILNLLAALQASTGTALIFISHDLAVVRHLSDRVLAMDHGRVAEAPAP
jgi:ABC-type glutathione transport system ATPase component